MAGSMIHPLVNNTLQTTRDPIALPNFWEKISEILSKVWEAIKIIFYILAGVTLFIANDALFAIGFVLGVIFDAKVSEIAEKVMRIYNESRWQVLAIIGTGAVLSLPVTAATLAIGYGAHLGYSLLNPQKDDPEEFPLLEVVIAV